MLTVTERGAVRDALENVLLHAANPATALTAIFSPNDGMVLTAAQNAADHRERATLTLRCCLRDRWSRSPSLLWQLLADLVVRGRADLANLRDRVLAGEDPSLDPVNSSWFTAEQPFFGRSLIRAKVKTLLDRSDKPVMLLQGPAYSGKTYTGKWLNYLADEARCDFRIVLEALDKGTGPSTPPDLLAESLVAKMGRPIDKMPAFTPHRYEKRLCNWITSEALQAPGYTWIVLDGFDDPNLNHDTAALIQELAASLLEGELSRRVRLVLIDFKSKLAKVDALRLEQDSLPSPDTLDRDHFSECLRQHFVNIDQDVDESFLEGLAAKLIQDAQKLRAQPEYESEPLLKVASGVVYRFRQQDLIRLGRV